MKQYITLIIGCLLLGVSCTSPKESSNKPTLTVSIEPLRYFTEAIAGDRFKVVSMVPEGNSPETYDPTPQQLVAQAKSKAFLRIGYIGFEQTWLKKLQDNAPGQPFYDLSKGVALMAGGCSHEEDNAHNHAHEGVEPHIWNSVKNARIIANNIFQALSEIDNEQTPYYQHRLDSLLQVIDNPYFPDLSSGTDLFRPRLRTEPDQHRSRWQGTLSCPPEGTDSALPGRTAQNHFRPKGIRYAERENHRPGTAGECHPHQSAQLPLERGDDQHRQSIE